MEGGNGGGGMSEGKKEGRKEGRGRTMAVLTAVTAVEGGGGIGW